MSAQGDSVFQFGECELDTREHRLRVRGQPVTLTPKVFATLVLLVERAGHVVSKDELMAALWPRGFVHESNLTKHIWLIRRALGEAEGARPCIETVPKLGYRFVAPVTLVDGGAGTNVAAPAPGVAEGMPTAAEARAAPLPAPARAAAPEGAALRLDAASRPGLADALRRRVPYLAIALLALPVLAVFIAAVIGWRNLRPQPSAVPGTPGSAVAVVDFNNLSDNAKDAWLGPALAEMLATEIAAGGKLHAVPDELVQSARAGLPAPRAGGYAAASLATLRRRLDNQYVLSGSYLVYGNPDSPQLRLDLTLQDVRSGATVSGFSRSGAVAELPALVIAAGAGLRAKLGVGALSRATLQRAANAQPPSEEVARHLGFALDALRRYDPARARDELLQAIAQAPGYAPAYMYLAQAWSALGYRAKALAASRQALQNAAGLPAEQRLQIEAQQSTLQGDQARTIDALRKLVALRPQDPEYRLQLIGALAGAGKADAAAAALPALRGLPGMPGDPRVELAEVQVATARNDAAAQIAHARRALQLAQLRGEAGFAASAELRLGIALDQEPQAEPLLHQAAADYRRIGNPHGEAQAYQNLGNLFFARNQIAPAREAYQRAMAMYQGIGDLGGEAAVYDDLTRMLWAAGDRDGAETAVRQALRIGRETNDLVRQAWSLTGLATILSDDSAGDEVAALYRQALALDQQAGERAHHVFALSTYADLLRQRGELDRARDVCVAAQGEAAALGDPGQGLAVDSECSQIALDRGEVDVASKGFAQVLQRAQAAHDTFDVADARLLIGQVAMGRRQWAPARDALQASLKDWTASEEVAGQAVSEGLLALCHAALGDAGARDAAAAQARALRGRLTQRQEIAPLDIALAQLRGAAGSPGEAIAALQSIADDAGKRHWVGISMEARLASVQLLERGNDPAAAKAARDALVARARTLGYGWVLQRLALTAPARQSARPR